MEISVSQAQGKVPVTVMKIDGRLDGQNYQELIKKAQELFSAGACDFLLDLTDLTFISSSGLVALCSVAMLARGEKLSEAAEGEAEPVTRPIVRATESGAQQHFKLLNPRPEIMHVFDIVGLGTMFDVFTNLEEAVNSFS
ncbi:MAG TPA: STAS domain-containing protein [Anaerolineales bacterium]|nr:STAS domain-containing protein [Anaerolineales bacterium]